MGLAIQVLGRHHVIVSQILIARLKRVDPEQALSHMALCDSETYPCTAAIPGRTLPSKYSSMAPPPVLT